MSLTSEYYTAEIQSEIELIHSAMLCRSKLLDTFLATSAFTVAYFKRDKAFTILPTMLDVSLNENMFMTQFRFRIEHTFVTYVLEVRR